MNRSKGIGFGFRGWMMIIYQALGFYLFTIINSFGQNIQASANGQFFGWTPTNVSTIYTITILIAVVFQLVFSRKIARAKNIKRLSIIFMVIGVICGFGIATIFASEKLWLLIFAVGIFFSQVGSTLIIGILVGQWFPRRKGTVMGISTLAFPIAGGLLLSIFARLYFTKGALAAYLPFLIIAIIGIVIGIVFIRDYPEQCGAYRDNDKNMTPEMAKEIMEQEIEAKKNSVWTLARTLSCRDFWFMTIPAGILLATSVGAMTQIVNILNMYPEFYAKYGTLVTAMVTVVACLGSYVLGLIDTRLGTKKAVVISCAIAVASGIVGFIPSVPTLVTGFMLLCIFEGAASNFAVSLSAQYWKREDFPSVYGVVNPIANVIQAFGPMLIAIVGFSMGFHVVFGVIGILSIVALVLILLFNPKHLSAVDEKLHEGRQMAAEEG